MERYGKPSMMLFPYPCDEFFVETATIHRRAGSRRSKVLLT